MAQDDCMLHTLTVKENIAFSANLRLPRKVSSEEKVKRVDDLIKRLGLTRCQDTLIGNAAVRGVSGGERKRTAIAMEIESVKIGGIDKLFWCVFSGENDPKRPFLTIILNKFWQFQAKKNTIIFHIFSRSFNQKCSF